jgi:hypothetical protein
MENQVIRFSDLATWLKKYWPIRFVVVKHLQDECEGIAFMLGESLSDTWRSGDVIIHWANGQHTTCDDDDLLEIVNRDIIGHHTTEDGEDIE